MLDLRYLLPLLGLLWMAGCEEPLDEPLPAEPEQPTWGVVDEPDLPVPEWMNPDSLIRQWTDTLVGSIKTDTLQGRRRVVLYPATFTPIDSVAYTVEGGNLTSIIARFTPPAQELYLEYYFHEGDLRYVRHREWNLRPENVGAREMNFFFKEGELFFVRDRKTALEIGEPPARIAFHRLRPSQRPREELLDEVQVYWPMVREMVDKARAERGF